MNYSSTLTSKNQTTIPKGIVEALQIKPSATLCYELEADGSVRLTAKTKSFHELAGTFAPKRALKKRATDEEIKTAVVMAAVDRFKKSVQ